MKPEVRLAIENLLNLKERETTMDDYFDNTADDQHDHAHEFPEHDVDPNYGDKTNAQSKHQKRDQHKQKKELKNMNRIIKNNITPALAAFAVSMAILFGLSFDAKGFDAKNFNGNERKAVLAPDTFNADLADSYQDAVCQDFLNVKDVKFADFYIENNDGDDMEKDARIDLSKSVELDKVRFTDDVNNRSIDDPDQEFVAAKADIEADYDKEDAIADVTDQIGSFDDDFIKCDNDRYAGKRDFQFIDRDMKQFTRPDDGKSDLFKKELFARDEDYKLGDATNDRLVDTELDA